MFDMFKNEIIHGIHISRYCSSWINAGGQRFDYHFRTWLKSLEIDGKKLTEDEIRRIQNYAGNGKLELEDSARLYFKYKGL